MSHKKLYATINSGKYKGKKIQLPSLSTTRSTKNILKESLFNTLQYDIIDKNFIEVFGGSGIVGLEALSKGAKKAFFIEKDIDAYKILKQNIDSIDKNSCELWQGDSFVVYNNLIDGIDEKTYIYFDPPFEIRDGMEDIYQKVYKLIKSTPAKIVEMIIIEHMSKLKIPDKIGLFTKKKSKKFGKSSLTYFIVE